MTDPVPSKECSHLYQAHLRELFGRCLTCEIESLQRQVDALSIHSAKWVTRALELQTNIARITGEREPPHCSTCACGLAPEPRVCTDCLATPGADGKVQHCEGCSATYVNMEIVR